jgi:hypothetical protein
VLIVVPVADPGEVTIVVPPLKTSPMSVGPTAVAVGAVGAFARATGAAIASETMTAVTRAVRLRTVVVVAEEAM